MTGGGVDFRELAKRGRVHFVGVGGAGMAPLAELVLRSGVEVSGCDIASGRALRALAALGMTVHVGHDPRYVTGARAVVATPAVPAGHPELAQARAEGIPVFKRAVALGHWIRDRMVIAVAGTHGKTTTTAMATHVLAHAGLDPTGVVGGEVTAWGGHLRMGSSEIVVVEADEYDRSFHEIAPQVAVVTSLEADHLDIYGDLDGVRASFSEFLARLAPDGTLWVCGDDPGAARLGVLGGARAGSYGTGPGAQVRATRLRRTREGTTMTVTENGRNRGRLMVPMAGLHNARNALAAACVGRSQGVSWSQIRGALACFGGVSRRHQALGEEAGVLVIDDYAHHPTEVTEAVAAARGNNPARRLVAVFQPHLYSRTRDFRVAFGHALSQADRVWVTDVYPAREAPIEGVTGRIIADAVTAAGAPVRYHRSLETLAGAVADGLVDGDICLVMGAGSIERTGAEILDLLGARVHGEARGA